MTLIVCDRKFYHFLSQVLLKTNINYVLTLVFLRWVLIRLVKFQKTRLKVTFLSDSVFQSIVEKYFDSSTSYIDPASCILGKLHGIESSGPTYVNICSRRSSKKYKTLLVPLDKAANNEIYLSETTLFNVENFLAMKNHSLYFILPASIDAPRWAEEVKISLIKHPNSCSQDLIDVLLKNYFSRPRFLRANDRISASVEKYAPQFLFTNSDPRVVYFRVNSISLDHIGTGKACYICRDESTLIQEGSTHGYLPRMYSLSIPEINISTVEDEIESRSVSNVPPGFSKSLEALQTSILPFTMSDNWQGLRPIFLLEGPCGSGKYKLTECLSQTMGFNFISVDCREIQTLPAAQTEIKLRLILQNAENSTPCILKLSNIDNIGKNSEGKIDERITSNFTEQLDNIYEKNTKFPLVIIGTLEDGEIPADVGKNFITKIHMTPLNNEAKISLLEWLLSSRKMQHQAELPKIVGMCSDYTFNDLQTLILHAAKNSCKKWVENHENKLILHQDDFMSACDYMQKMFSSRIGAAKVPEVHWEDIGGLASLKHEIIRRIEIPLMTNTIRSSGILLYGPPGTGKTLLAKAVATECRLHFLSVKGPELLNMYVGQSEKNVRDIFEKARAASPCIIFFDELDALAPNRGRSGDSGGVMDRVVSQLLAEMDGLDSVAKIFIIAATNRPDLIDPALLRPGRFDKLLYVGIHSDPASQLSVLQAITRKFALESTCKLDEIVKKLPQNVTGADLHSVCSNAWLNAARRLIETYESDLKGADKNLTVEKPDGVVTVGIDDFLHAVDTLVPSVNAEELARYVKLHDEISLKNVKM